MYEEIGIDYDTWAGSARFRSRLAKNTLIYLDTSNFPTVCLFVLTIAYENGP
jgi:hypothetical protein